MIKLSVVTINFNNLEGLKKTFSSIYPLSHGMNNFIEHIVIDGYSTDGGQEFLESNVNLGYKLIIEPDKGIFDAMNKGLSLANGDYIIFMNSGDRFCDSILSEKFLEKLEGFDLIYGNIYTEKGGVENRQVQTGQLDFFYMLGKTICHQSVFMKTSLCKKYGFPESEQYSLMGDWIQLFQILRAEKIEIKHLNDFVCIYNIEGESEKQKDRRISQRKDFLRSVYSEWELKDLEKIARLRNRKYYSFLIRSLDKFSYSLILKGLAKLQWH